MIRVTVKLDTGAQCDVMSLAILNSIEPNADIVKSKVKLYAYGGSDIPIVGQVNFKCQFNDSTIYSNFIIVPLNVKQF